MVGVHIGLDLEDECRHLFIGCFDRASISHLLTRRRRNVAKRIDQIAHPEIAKRRAKENRRQMAFKKGLAVKRAAGFARQFQLIDKGLALVFGQMFGHALSAR